MALMKAGEVFKLKDLIEYKEGTAQKKFLVNLPTQKVVLVSVDHGELASHPAPLNVLIFVIDGKGIIEYNGVDYEVKEGDNFKFDQGVMHSVRTDHKLKLALVMTEAEL